VYLGWSGARWDRFWAVFLPSEVTFSEEPFLPDLEDPVGEAFGSGVDVGVFACLVLVLAPSWIVVDTESDSLRSAVEPLRALVLASVLVPVTVPVLVLLPWLCLRGREEVVPGGGWGDCGADEEAAGVLEAVILPCSAAHERTEESESLRCGWRRPSGLCLESLASLDMAPAGRR